jgi:hypothetical protein
LLRRMPDRVSGAVAVEDVVNAAKLFADLGAIAAEGSMMGRRGRTNPTDIAKIERLSFVMARRLEGRTFREIGLLMTPPISAQMAHRLFWRVIAENPPSRQRQLAVLRRLAASDDHASG